MQKRQRHALGRPRVGPFPKLSEIRCFCGFSTFRRAHKACRCRFRGGRDTPMGGGDGGTNGCVVGGGALGVSGPQNPKFSSIWVEKRLKDGSETARATADFRRRSRPALLLEVMNDRGSCTAIGPGIEEAEPCPCQGAPRAVFPDALP
jgi:hypothetical protein